METKSERLKKLKGVKLKKIIVSWLIQKNNKKRWGSNIKGK